MKLNIKKIFLVIMVMLFIGIGKVSALTSEEIDKLDSDSKIYMPTTIYNTGSKVSIYKTTDYKLFYQWQEISLDLYNNLKSKNNEINNLVNEVNEYQKNNKSTDSSDTEAITAYNNKIKEYQSEYDKLVSEYYTLLPSFKSDWSEADQENKIYPPSEVFSGSKPFVLYVKLEDNQDNTVSYDYGILQLDGESESSTVDSTVESTEEKTTVTDATQTVKTTTTNPSTTDSNIYAIVALIVLFSGIIVLGTKKLKNSKN